MNNWKIQTNFIKTGFEALAEENLGIAFERGSGDLPGYLTIDIYPDKDPKYPQRHFGNWQFPFADIANADKIVLTVNKDGVKLSADSETVKPHNVINGPLREDGLYSVFVVLNEKETYAEIDKTLYFRQISISGATLDNIQHWPGRSRRSPTELQPECWMMRCLATEIEAFAATLAPGSRVLDYGGGNADYFPFFAKNKTDYQNAEIYRGQLVDILCEQDKPFPIEDCTYHAAICIHVIEHTPEPWRIAAELHRILKPGGKLLMGIPFAWEHHHEPNDYWRFGKNGIEMLLKDFASIDIKTDGNSEQALLMLKNTHYYNTKKSGFMRDFLIRRGNRKYLKAAKCTDESFSCNYIITATK